MMDRYSGPRSCRSAGAAKIHSVRGGAREWEQEDVLRLNDPSWDFTSLICLRNSVAACLEPEGQPARHRPAGQRRAWRILRSCLMEHEALLPLSTPAGHSLNRRRHYGSRPFRLSQQLCFLRSPQRRCIRVEIYQELSPLPWLARAAKAECVESFSDTA